MNNSCAKSQTISEWIYEVIVLPKHKQKLSKFLPSLHRAEILTIFYPYFGRKDEFINSFWNCVTFTAVPVIRYLLPARQFIHICPNLMNCFILDPVQLSSTIVIAASFPLGGLGHFNFASLEWDQKGLLAFCLPRDLHSV